MRVEAQYISPQQWEEKHEWDRYVRWGKRGLAVELPASDPPQREIREHEIRKEGKEIKCRKEVL